MLEAAVEDRVVRELDLHLVVKAAAVEVLILA
jgi:hypothetical protein